MDQNSEYFRFREIILARRLPLAFVDLDKFDRNIAFVASTQRNTGKTIRVHSRSVRCLDLLKRIFDLVDDVYKDVMTISMEETAYLTENGLDDFIVAYPTVQSSDMELLAEMTRKGVQVSLMADSMEQLAAMSAAGQKAGVKIKACLEIDMTYRSLNARGIHLGLRRSPVRSVEEALAVSDDMHADLFSPEHPYTPCAIISDACAQNLIINTSPTKGFNLSGPKISNIQIQNEVLRRLFFEPFPHSVPFSCRLSCPYRKRLAGPKNERFHFA